MFGRRATARLRRLPENKTRAEEGRQKKCEISQMQSFCNLKFSSYKTSFSVSQTYVAFDVNISVLIAHSDANFIPALVGKSREPRKWRPKTTPRGQQPRAELSNNLFINQNNFVVYFASEYKFMSSLCYISRVSACRY